MGVLGVAASSFCLGDFLDFLLGDSFDELATAVAGNFPFGVFFDSSSELSLSESEELSAAFVAAGFLPLLVGVFFAALPSESQERLLKNSMSACWSISLSLLEPSGSELSLSDSSFTAGSFRLLELVFAEVFDLAARAIWFALCSKGGVLVSESSETFVSCNSIEGPLSEGGGGMAAVFLDFDFVAAVSSASPESVSEDADIEDGFIFRVNFALVSPVFFFAGDLDSFFPEDLASVLAFSTDAGGTFEETLPLAVTAAGFSSSSLELLLSEDEDDTDGGFTFFSFVALTSFDGFLAGDLDVDFSGVFFLPAATGCFISSEESLSLSLSSLDDCICFEASFVPKALTTEDLPACVFDCAGDFADDLFVVLSSDSESDDPDSELELLLSAFLVELGLADTGLEDGVLVVALVASVSSSDDESLELELSPFFAGVLVPAADFVEAAVTCSFSTGDFGFGVVFSFAAFPPSDCRDVEAFVCF